MEELVIKVEQVGKLYRLGEVGTGTISHDLNRWWARVRHKEDPTSKVAEVNDRTLSGTSDFVWALQEVNFEVKKGEVLGIVGRNGAGKSTLLKILSKVTRPSTGVVRLKGRVASLLEVGTGFHPDSLIYSPRSGEEFRYAVNDTARVKTYLLEDPASDDYIGTLEPDITRLNAASWE